LNGGLIPTQPEDGCPENSFARDRFDTCTCEEHCSWDLCRLEDAPSACLKGTFSKWVWAKHKMAWVAKVQDIDNQGK